MFGSFHPLERIFIMTFSSDIKAFAEKTKTDIADVKKYAAIKIFTDIVKATPVGSPDYWQEVNGKPRKAPPGYTGGRLRGNWQTSLNTPIHTEIARIDPEGGDVLKEMESIVYNSGVEESIFLTNNLPYAVPVEYGHSRKQRPMGMLRVSIAGFENAIKEALQKVKQ